MYTRDDIEAAARTFLTAFRGGPVRWRHQGRDPQTGIDCVGLVVCTAELLGEDTSEDLNVYERYPDGKTLRAKLESVARPKPLKLMAKGDIVLMNHINTVDPCHVGIITELYGAPAFIHAYLMGTSRIGRVVEQTLDDDWQRQFIACYEWPNLVEA